MAGHQRWAVHCRCCMAAGGRGISGPSCLSHVPAAAVAAVAHCRCPSAPARGGPQPACCGAAHAARGRKRPAAAILVGPCRGWSPPTPVNRPTLAAGVDQQVEAGRRVVYAQPTAWDWCRFLAAGAWCRVFTVGGCAVHHSELAQHAPCLSGTCSGDSWHVSALSMHTAWNCSLVVLHVS